MTSSLILCKWWQFPDWIEMCNEKWILYDNQWWPGQWMDWEAKALLKAKLIPKKVKVSVWWSAVTWSTTAFWIPVKPLHLRSLLSKSIRCAKNCNACSWHRSTDRTQFFSMKMPGCRLQNKHFKSWTNWATKFCLICHIHLTSCQPATTLQASAQLFAGKTLSQPAGGRKCFPRIHQILKHGCYSYK